MNNKSKKMMKDIAGIIVVAVVFRVLGIILKAIIGGDRWNDFRRNR